MASETWVKFGSDTVLLPDGTKPLPEPMLTNIDDGRWYSPQTNYIRSVIEIIRMMYPIIIILESSHISYGSVS